jgi:hypothetical protein
MRFWKKKKTIKIPRHEITEEALFRLGYKWGINNSITIAIDENNDTHFSFDGKLIGYVLDQNKMTFTAVTNKYIWENL